MDFLGSKTVLEILLTQKTKNHLVVPLVCRVYYKGFSALVTTQLEIHKEENLAYGFRKNDTFQNSQELTKELNQIGKRLKILPHSLKSILNRGEMAEITISQFIKIYKTKPFTKNSLIEQTAKKYFNEEQMMMFSIE